MNRKIILAIDFTPPNQSAITHLLMNHVESDEVIILHIIDDNGFDYFPTNQKDEEFEYAEKLKKLEILALKFNCPTQVKIFRGNVSETITNFINSYNPDMLVVGYHKHNFFDKLLYADIREDILERKLCPVLSC